jgi:hypothetical protein
VVERTGRDEAARCGPADQVEAAHCTHLGSGHCTGPHRAQSATDHETRDATIGPRVGGGAPAAGARAGRRQPRRVAGGARRRRGEVVRHGEGGQGELAGGAGLCGSSRTVQAGRAGAGAGPRAGPAAQEEQQAALQGEQHGQPRPGAPGGHPARGRQGPGPGGGRCSHPHWPKATSEAYGRGTRH